MPRFGGVIPHHGPEQAVLVAIPAIEGFVGGLGGARNVKHRGPTIAMRGQELIGGPANLLMTPLSLLVVHSRLRTLYKQSVHIYTAL
ncbi:hypothetical protein D3C87_1409030 [compost metagenome]